MLHILLIVLKIIGIVLAVILGLFLLAVLLVLFVPIRYRIKAAGRIGQEQPLRAEIKVTWLLHIINMTYIYPSAAYLRVRIFCFALFDPSKPRKEKKIKKNKPDSEVQTPAIEYRKEEVPDNADEEYWKSTELEEKQPVEGKKAAEEGTADKVSFISWLKNILKKMFNAIKNIEYTIKSICDKIRNIIENIEYYVDVLQSDLFKDVLRVSKKRILRILRGIRPSKCNINLTLGTGDPAVTGQILAVYGILYPFIGNNVSVLADFENEIVEGDLYIKGKIVVFGFLMTAFQVYCDRNIRKLLKMFKREDV